jgi:hypothetical protein
VGLTSVTTPKLDDLCAATGAAGKALSRSDSALGGRPAAGRPGDPLTLCDDRRGAFVTAIGMTLVASCAARARREGALKPARSYQPQCPDFLVESCAENFGYQCR